MRRFVLFGGALCALIFGLGRSPLATTQAETMAQRQRAAEGLVAEALRGELDGADGRRKELLRGALEKSPDYAPARWHTGHVQERNRWVRFDEVARLSAEDSRLAAYRHARQQHGETIEGQMELAAWCAKRKLADQQRVHLTKVLELDPNHGEARRLLGHRYVDGGWLTPQQVTDTELRSRQAVAAMRRWKTKLASILAGLQQRSQAKREAAVERLLAIDDPTAIGAMEAVLAGHSEAAALLLVRALAEMPAAEAAMALARQALASPSEKVRDAAAEKLKLRDLHSYVPQLLGAMGSKVQSQAQLYTSPSGRLVYRHTFARKGQGHNEVAVFETEYRGTVLSAQRPEEIAASRTELGRQRQMDAVMKAQSLEMAKAQQNSLIDRINERICRVLSTATGANLPPEPEAWWKWWNEYNEVFYAGAKPVKATYRREQVAFDDPYPKAAPVAETGSDGPPPTPIPRPTPNRRTSMGSAPGSRISAGNSMYECLVAGTPVWTESGFVPIEQIRSGDRVLAQDPATGELAYKPVLRTTIRPAGPLVEVAAGDLTIGCSGGHPFWIAGQGWIKARELREGTFLHGAAGTLPVRSVEKAEARQTYNLIVADFHTYFVGEAMVLSHDNSIRRPTDTIVPGLVQR